MQNWPLCLSWLGLILFDTLSCIMTCRCCLYTSNAVGYTLVVWMCFVCCVMYKGHPSFHQQSFKVVSSGLCVVSLPPLNHAPTIGRYSCCHRQTLFTTAQLNYRLCFRLYFTSYYAVLTIMTNIRLAIRTHTSFESWARNTVNYINYVNFIHHRPYLMDSKNHHREPIALTL